MASPSPILAPQQKPLEDPFDYLPCSKVSEFRRGDLIYRPGETAVSLYSIVKGMVKISRNTGNGSSILMDIYGPEEFFGESALLHLPYRDEQATALENTTIMGWSTSQIEDLAVQRPHLGIALTQLMARRALDFTCRIESLSRDHIVARLARSLLRLSERFGTANEDGSTTMLPLTHDVLSQYVGTSRELITTTMLQFRRDGYIRYSRKEISIYRDALESWLNRTE